MTDQLPATTDNASPTFSYDLLPGDIATALRAHEGSITTRLKRTMQDVIEIGSELRAAAKLLSRPMWESWIETQLGISVRTASYYGAISKEFADDPAALNLKPAVAMELASPSFPAEKKQEIVERAGAGEIVTLAEVRKVKADAKATAESGKPAQGVQSAPAPMKAANTDASLTGSVAPALPTVPAAAPKLTKAEKKTLKQEEEDARLLLKADIAWLADLLQAKLAPAEWDRARALLDNRLVVEIDPEHGSRALVRVMDRRKPKAQAALVAEIKEAKNVDEYAFIETNVMNVAA